MPELPDLTIYLEQMAARIQGEPLERVRIASPFLLQTVAPPITAAEGRRVIGFRRVGKRLVLELEGGLFLVIHLMIAGRLHWRPRGAPLNRRLGLAAFDFPAGSLVLTEASKKRRATLHLVAGEEALAALDPGGIEVLMSTREEFAAALRRENHTLKRALTDPRLFAGIGNSYSDEILHRAQLSPVKLTQKLTPEEIARLHQATIDSLREWVERLRADTGTKFPEKVTAFRPEMAVHGRFGKPCPVCGAPVQRIVHAENETNYCARCQTGGKLLADRALSKLLRGDWPRTLEELEERRGPGGDPASGDAGPRDPLQ
jgi:formamidopyrimidine-DNA glycosylase